MIIESNHVQKKEKQGDLLSLIRFGIVMDVLQHIGEGWLGVSLWYRRYILHHNNIAMSDSLKGTSKDLNVLEIFCGRTGPEVLNDTAALYMVL